MNLKNILWVRNTGHIVPSAPIGDNLFGMKLSGGVITTVTGNPVSIVTNKAQDAISTLLSYSPKQSGTGDPSPQNIRPIEGWTEAVLHVNEDTITANLGGTYYGFAVDLERGVLRGTQKLIDFSTFGGQFRRAGTSEDHYYFQCNWTDDDLGTGILVCDILPYEDISSANTMRGVGVVRSSTYGKLVIGIRPVDNCNMSYGEFRTWLDNQTTFHICIPLATPIELPLTPQTVALLAGNNTLWTDGDSIEITYKAKK